VNAPTAPPTNSNATSTAARIGWALLILATLYVCYFSHLSAIGFVGPDEPRYAWIARDMAETGDWVTPRLYGKPWFEKPILYYWSAALFFKLSEPSQTPPSTAQSPTTPQSPNAFVDRQPRVGSTPRISAETAARLPSAIYALLATLAMAWLALRIYGLETARWLLLLLPTTVGMIGFSHAASTDMPFSATLTIAMVFAAVLLRLVPTSPHTPVGAQHVAPFLGTIPNPTQALGAALVYPDRVGAPPADASPTNSQAATDPAPPISFSFTSFTSSTSFASFLFGFFLGLAVLAKGPAALILSGGAVLFWALFTKRWRDAFRLFHPIAVITFCLTALPWYILCARRNPDFFRVFIIEHNFKRYLTPEFQHIQPFWYYLPIVLVAFFPWIALLLWSCFAAVQHLLKTKSISPATLFLLTWSAFCILFFSASHSKLPGYVLPAVPAVGLLLAHYLDKYVMKHLSKVRWVFLGVGTTFLAAGIALNRLGDRIPFVTDIRPAPTVVQLAFCSVIAGVVVGFLGLRALARPAIFASTIAFLILLNMGNDNLWELDAGVSARPAAESAINHLTQAQLNAATTYKLQRGLKYNLDFYLQREINEWSPEIDPNSLVFTTYKGSLELKRTGVRCFHYVSFPAVVICGAPTDRIIGEVGSVVGNTTSLPSP